MPDADIYQGDRLVAHFDRVRQGVRLSFIEGVMLDRGFLASTLPSETITGSELPAFFLNLLPEGARLQLLLASARAKDDTLSLLLKVGWDSIGDVAVLPPGEKPGRHAPAAMKSRFQDVSFWDVFHAGVGENPDHAVPGVQEKISAGTIAFGVRTSNIPSAILKLNPPKYPRLVQNEEFFLRMAKHCGLAASRATIVQDKHEEFGLLVTRFDRVKRGRSVVKLHQEDGCQLLDAVPANKYDLPLREIAAAIARVSTAKVIEIERLLRLVAFSYLIGNNDLHAKNISVLWNGVVKLSPAYDLLSTLPYPNLIPNMALKIQGKDKNLRTGDFIEFAKPFQLPEQSVAATVRELCDRVEPWLSKLHEIGFDEKQTSSLETELRDRLRRMRT